MAALCSVEMSLNALLALEILEIASNYPGGVPVPSEAAELDRYPELRRTFDILVRGSLGGGRGGRYVLSQRGIALITSLEEEVAQSEARKKKLSTLVLDVSGSRS